MAIPVFTLRSVTSGGALNQFFPDVHKIDISPVFSDIGTISFEYPEGGVNFALLDNDVELAVMLNGVEIPELRCIIESFSGDDANEAAGGNLWTFTAHTILGSLSQAVIYPPLWPLTDAVKHVYTNANAGKILSDFIGYAHTRGTLTWLTYDFTATHDSAGATWGNPIDMEFNVGLKYTEIVKSLVDAGTVEVRMNGRVLQAYNPDTMGTDRTTGSSPVVFFKGRDMQASPRKSSTRDLATAILMGGENKIYAERTAGSGPIATYGRRESYLSVQHVQTIGALDVIGDLVIGATDRPLLEITHSLNFDSPSNPQPVLNFDVGDWVYSDVGKGLERHRVKQWVLSVFTGGSNGVVVGTVTLNDLIGEQLAKVHRRLTNIENGTVSSGPSTNVDDGRSPAAPTSVTLGSSSYIDFNRARAIISVGWAGVTTNSDGVAATNITGYAARWRYSSDSSTLWRQTRQLDSSVLATTFDNVDPGQSVVVEVVAFNTFGRYGAWSADVLETTAIDTVPPAQPSSAVVTNNVGTLRIYWDGLDNTGSVMAADFVGVEVHLGPNGTFTPNSTTLKDFLPGSAAQSTTITSGLTYGTQYWARLVAVDSSGNKSTPSVAGGGSTAILTQVVNTEIGTGQVGLANTRFSDVGNLVDDGSFEASDVQAARALLFAGSHFAWDNSTSSNGTWSLRHDSWTGGATSESLMLQGSLPVKPGERVFGAADYRFTSSTPASSYVYLAVKWKDKSGNYLDNTGAINNVYYDLTNNWWAAADNAWHARVAGTSKVAPPNVATMELWLITANRTGGTIWIDAVEVRRQIDTLLIGDAAITTAKIANLAVNDAQIGSMNVGKLVAGTLSVDVTVSSRIKTADTGVRVELNSTGIGAWDGSGNQTVNISSADGSATIIGNFRSGTSGRRVDINPGNTGLPEIRFYPTSGSNYGFLNAVAGGTGGVNTYVGLNSGQFTANGQTSSFRSYLTDTSASLELIRDDTQGQWGGGIHVWTYGVSASYSGTNRAGFWDVFNTNSTFGWDGGGSTTTVQNWMNFDQSGITTLIGRFPNYLSATANNNIFTGILNLSGAGGIVVTYGATMLGAMGCGGTLVDSSGTLKSWQITSATSTSYTVSFSGAATGAWIIWTYRC